MRHLGVKSLFFFCLAFGMAKVGQALPVEIAWQAPLKAGGTFELEIARDAGFGEVVHTETVTVRGPIKWEAPGEGIYHWRLNRPGPAGAERNTFLSGSFAVIDPAVERSRSAVVSWAPVEGADRYKIYVLEGGARRRIMMTTATTFFVPRLSVALTIEVAAYQGGRQVSDTYQFDPSLALDSATVATESAEPVEEVRPSPVGPPPEEPLGTSPAEETPEQKPPGREATPEAPTEPEGEPVVTEEPPMEGEPEKAEESTEPASQPFTPKHLVKGFLLFEDELLRVQKLEVDARSRERLGGVGAAFFSNPVAGLVFSGMGAYHEHKANLSADELGRTGGDDTFKVDQARYTIDLGIGWNLLHGFDVGPNLLTVHLVAAMAQLPVMPLSFQGGPNTLPSLKKKTLNLIGGGGSYGYFATLWGILVEAGLAVQDELDARLSYQRLQLYYFPKESFAVELGLFARLTSLIDCHEDAATCLREGKIRTSSQETGVMVGAGMVLW